MAAVVLLCDLGVANEPFRWVVVKCAKFEGVGPLAIPAAGTTAERARTLVNDPAYTETVEEFFINTMDGFPLVDCDDPILLPGLEPCNGGRTISELVSAMAQEVWLRHAA